MTIVFVSHDLGSIERFSDRVIRLEEGRVAETGDARDIVSGYLRELARRSPAARRQLELALRRALAAWREEDRIASEDSGSVEAEEVL